MRSQFATGTIVSDTMTITGVAAAGFPAGNVQFSYCYNASLLTIPDCATAARTDIGGPVAVTGNTSGSVGTAISSALPYSVVGTYCFAAIYTPSATANYSPVAAVESPGLVTGSTTECFRINSPTAVTVDRFEANPGSGSLSMSNTLVLGLGAVGVTLIGLLAFVIARKR